MADMRAMEEENARVNMRGSGHYIGAGATPSMGLSQFRGGSAASDRSWSQREIGRRKISGQLFNVPKSGGSAASDRSWSGREIERRKISGQLFNVPKSGAGMYDSDSDSDSDSSCDSECEMVSGRNRCRHGGGRKAVPVAHRRGGLVTSRASKAVRVGHRRGGLVTSRAIVPYHAPTSTAIVPYHAPSSAIVPYHAPSTYHPPVTTLSTGRATPAHPASYYQNLLRNRGRTTGRPSVADRAPQGMIEDHIPTAYPVRGPTRGSTSMASRIAMALAAGIPLAALGLVAADMAGAFDQPNSGSSGNSPGNAPGDEGPMGDLPAPPPDYAPGPSYAPGSGTPGGPGSSGGPGGYGGDPMGPGGVPPGLTGNELAWYLQSGNLPDRYFVGNLSQRRAKYGRGKKASSGHDGRSARAEIVRNVMREQGLSLPQASKYVKDHGLY
jgi:hypothetical protein